MTAQPTIVIIGGAIVGSMSAWFLRQEGFAGKIIVLERDPTYRFASTTLSAASIRTQFGCPINVRMSLFGVSFFKTLTERFGPGADIGFRENGYLILGDEAAIAARHDVAHMQMENGAAVSVLTPDDLQRRFPWLNTDGVGVATFGEANEGWFDAWSLLQLVRTAAKALDVTYLHAEATGIRMAGNRVTGVETANGDFFAADIILNAAGPASGKVASWLGIDLPVSPRKRTVFQFKADLDGRNMPMLFDTGGAWVRPEGDGFIGGIVPPADQDPDATGDFTPDHWLFESLVWPALAQRVPAFERLRPGNSWAGHYEINALDHNGIIGRHPDIANLLFASGFSGHGVMHSPATGRGIAELVVHGAFRTLDLSPLGFERIRAGRPMIEAAVY